MAIGTLEVACPACSVTQWMQVKSALQPHLSPAKCSKCGEGTRILANFQRESAGNADKVLSFEIF